MEKRVHKTIKNNITYFYKLNIFKIYIMLILSLIVITLLVVSKYCNLNIGGTKPDFKCSSILIELSTLSIFYLGLLFVPQNYFIPVTGTTIINYVFAILIHLFISYNLACLIYNTWENIKNKVKTK